MSDQLLQADAPVDNQQTEGFGDWRDSVPEKFRTDGDVNGEAIFKSYQEFEKRMGQYGLPPETPDAYKLQLPEGVEAPEGFAEEFTQFAHANGLTQKQLDALMPEIITMAQEVMEEFTPTKEKAEAALREAWGDKFDSELALANKAFARYKDAIAPEDANNPAVIKVLAKIGAELGEDTKPAEGVTTKADAATLRSDPEYFMNTPRGAELRRQVNQAYGLTN